MLLLNERLQGVELLFPEAAMLLQPPCRRSQHPSRQATVRHASFLHAYDQPGGLQHAEVFRDGWSGDVERLAEVAYRTFAPGQALDHCAPSRVGERGEQQIERLVGSHSADMISYADDASGCDHVALEAHGRRHDFVVLAARYAKILQRVGHMMFEEHPLSLGDIETVMRCLHVAT